MEPFMAVAAAADDKDSRKNVLADNYPRVKCAVCKDYCEGAGSSTIGCIQFRESRLNH